MNLLKFATLRFTLWEQHVIYYQQLIGINFYCAHQPWAKVNSETFSFVLCNLFVKDIQLGIFYINRCLKKHTNVHWYHKSALWLCGALKSRVSLNIKRGATKAIRKSKRLVYYCIFVILWNIVSRVRDRDIKKTETITTIKILLILVVRSEQLKKYRKFPAKSFIHRFNGWD